MSNRVMNYTDTSASASYIDHERFVIACDRVFKKNNDLRYIGTLSEKNIHAILKYYYEPDDNYHEVALNGYYADIYNNKEVIEIQTRGFEKLKQKLNIFLNYYPVTIVHPLTYNKWIQWVDKETGELIKERKSPLHNSVYSQMKEVYKLKAILDNPNLKIEFIMLDICEVRYVNSTNDLKKKRNVSIIRYPLGIKEKIDFIQPQDYMQLVPYEITEPFTSRDFADIVKIPLNQATITLNILTSLKQVIRTGKAGRFYTYRINE